MVDVKHTPTPTPWRVDNLDDICIIGGDEEIVCIEDDYYPVAPTEENMEYIVKCVNMHDELVAVMSDIHEFLKRSGYDTTMVKETLKKAGAL